MADGTVVLGKRLRAEREMRGWSRSAMAGRLRGAAEATVGARLPDIESLSHMVKEWEAGKHGLSGVYQHLYALAFELAPDDLFADDIAVSARRCGPDVTDSFKAPWTGGNAVLILSGTMSAYMDRRRFVVITGSAMANPPLAWARPWTLVPGDKLASAAGGGRVDAEIVAALERRLAELWRLDDAIGGLDCARMADADLSVALTLLRQGLYHADIEQRLLSVAGGLCRMAGWACFDAARHTAAGRYWHAGLRLCHGAGDRLGAVYIMKNIGQQLSRAGAGRAAIAMLDGARSVAGPGAPGAVHAMLDAYQVRAHAALGEPDEAVRVLGRADERWDDRDPEDTPGWAYWMCRPSETIDANLALVEAGRPEAVGVNMSVRVARDGDSFTRSRVFALAIMASAELAQGELESALATAGSALDALSLTESARASHELTRFARRLPEREPAAREFRERLRDHRKAA
jgi:hypothetical protein